MGRRILSRLTQRKEHTLLACSLRPDILPEEGYFFRTLGMQRTHTRQGNAKYLELDVWLIQPVTTEEMNEAIPRPLNSPMSTEKTFRELSYRPSVLEEELKEWM